MYCKFGSWAQPLRGYDRLMLMLRLAIIISPIPTVEILSVCRVIAGRSLHCGAIKRGCHCAAPLWANCPAYT